MSTRHLSPHIVHVACWPLIVIVARHRISSAGTNDREQAQQLLGKAQGADGEESGQSLRQMSVSGNKAEREFSSDSESGGMVSFVSRSGASAMHTQKIAMQFGGEAIARGWLRGLDVTKKDHLLSFLQSSARRSRSNISPIGTPQPARQ